MLPWRHHTANVYLDRYVIIFGTSERGDDFLESQIDFNTMAYFDTETHAWICPQTTGVMPVKRRHHCACKLTYFLCLFLSTKMRGT